MLAQQLWRVGAGSIFVDGSFVTDKPHPNDIDAYFDWDRSEVIRGVPAQRLNAVGPFHDWSWSPQQFRPDPVTGKLHMPTWHRYRIEVFPNFGQTALVLSGRRLSFPELFRTDRDAGVANGIIELVGR